MKCKHEHVVISDSIVMCKFRAHCYVCGKMSAWTKTIKAALKQLGIRR